MCRAIAGLIRPTKTVVTFQKAAHETQFSKIKSEDKMDKSPWIKINKGDRRPEGAVLVIHEYQEVDYGDPLNAKVDCWDMVEAYWNTRAQSWIAHGKPIRNVTYWMPLPKAPWEYK